MSIQVLTPTECREVLTRTNIGRLGLALDNQPYVVPIHFNLDGDHLYSFATLGQKIEWMRTNPKVCVEVEEILELRRWTTVIVSGSYEELVHTTHYEEFRLRARELFETRPEWWQPASTRIDPHPNAMPVIYRIRIDRVTGRQAFYDAPDGDESTAGKPWWLSLLFESVQGPRT
jgi:uncharacterized protein